MLVIVYGPVGALGASTGYFPARLDPDADQQMLADGQTKVLVI